MEQQLADMRDALRDPAGSIKVPYMMSLSPDRESGYGVQVYLRTRKVGPVILPSEGQTVSDILAMLGNMVTDHG